MQAQVVQQRMSLSSTTKKKETVRRLRDQLQAKKSRIDQLQQRVDNLSRQQNELRLKYTKINEGTPQHLLNYGYIRRISKFLSQRIPNDIYLLCVLFSDPSMKQIPTYIHSTKSISIQPYPNL